MAARHEGVLQPSRQSLLAGTVLSFTLKDGHVGIIAPEERRTYDHIIHTNVGNNALMGLTDAQVKLILSRSTLSENELEQIWSLTATIQAEGLPGGYWTQLEVYVALHFIQSSERLSLSDMALKFAGSLQPPVQRITRRSSYAQAGMAHSCPTSARSVAAELPLALSRNQSVGESSGFPLSVPLHRTKPAASAASCMHSLRSQPTVHSLGHSSLSQAGLEPMDAVKESEAWEDRPSSRTSFRSTESLEVAGVDAMLRKSSVRTNTLDRAKNLAREIEQRCPDIVKGPVIEAAGLHIADASTLDRTHAHDLLVSIRTRHPKYKDPSSGLGRFKSNHAKQKALDNHNWSFEHRELSQALKEAVDSGYVGVAEALLSKGADVNVLREEPKHTLKGLRSKTPKSTSTNFIQTAASSNNVEMVCLLASRGVTKESMEKALEKAVKQNLPKVVLALLQHGADPNAMLGTIFRSAITSKSSEMATLLLRAPNKVNPAYLTASLPIAVSYRRTDLVALLVAYGADVNSDNASSLRTAVRAQHIELVLTLMKGKPSKQAVSSVIEDSISLTGSATVEEKYLLTEILLWGGASGDSVAKTLVQVVRGGHRGIAKLLVLHGASLHYNRAEALDIAVKSGNVAMLRTLLLGELCQHFANRLFRDIPQPFTEKQTYGIMSALIAKGAIGVPLDIALVAAVQQKLLNITKLLLDHKASVDYNEAQALQIAVSASDWNAFDLLLSKGRPQPSSMQYILPLVPSSPTRLRYDRTKAILDVANPASLPTSVLNVALVKAVDHNSLEADMNLVNLIIAAGANVDCSDGTCFRSAVKLGSVELLRLLLSQSSDPSSLSPAVTEVMKVEPSEFRRRVIAMLIGHGADGTAVSQALIDAMRENSPDAGLIHLLLNRANVNYGHGQALSVAVESCTRQILKIVMEVGKPSPITRMAALPLLFKPSVNDRKSKLEILIGAGISQRGLDNALIQEIENDAEKDMEVVRLLMFHNACCEYGNAKALRLAISQRDNTLLKVLVASGPGPQVLGTTIRWATEIVDSRTKYTAVSILLQGGAKGGCISIALAREVLDAREPDLKLIRLLVKYEADIGCLDAAAIKFAVSKPLHVDLLKILVTGKGAANTLPSLVPLAMGLQEPHRLPFLRIILDAGARGAQVDAALVEAVPSVSSCSASSQTTIEFLLQHNASVDYDRGKAIRRASAAGHSSILELLLNKGPNLHNLISALPLAMQASPIQSDSVASPRLSCVRLLTQAGVKGADAVHRAMIQAVQERDHILVGHLLLNHGDPNFENGASVSIATDQTDVQMLRLLANSNLKPTPRVFSNAYSVAYDKFERWLIEPATFLSINKILLDGGANGTATDKALAHTLAFSHNNVASQYYKMIIGCCSSLNADYERGLALRTAARLHLCDAIENLLSRKPSESTLRSAFISVFESGDSTETSLLTTVQLFFKHSGDQNWIYFQRNEPFESPLYQCLHHHGEKPLLLQCLFNNGCRPDVAFSWTFSESHGAEETSALLWLLCQDERTDLRTVETLLEHGADANFRTARSGTTPLMIAADSCQPDIVLKLLEGQARPDTVDNMLKSALYYATRCGSLEISKHLLKYSADPDDESLHIAARQANAPMVRLLLDHGASIDLPGTVSCDGRTPLGELCRKADPDADPIRVKDSLRAFQQRSPDLQRLFQKESLILQALNNASPLSMTRALLMAYPYLQTSINNEINILNPSCEKYYSPTMYVRHFKCKQAFRDRSLNINRQCCSISSCPAPTLEKLLRAFGCQDRFWDENAGASQPNSACGLPPHIIEAQEEAKKVREQQAEQRRIRQEEQDRRDAIQAAQDAEAEAERRRERGRLAQVEQERLADARENRRQIEALREEHQARANLERLVFEEQQDRLRSAAREEEHRIQRRETQRISMLKKEANIVAGIQKEKQKTIDKVSGMMREAQMTGAGGQQTFGRILGEIEDSPRRLT